MKATRPLEFVCFLPVPLGTNKDGTVYSFFAMDVFSKFLFNTGVESHIGKDNLLKHVRLLTDNKDFKKHKVKKYTIVFSGYEEFRTEIEAIISPLGKMVVDEAFVTKELNPALEEFLKILK